MGFSKQTHGTPWYKNKILVLLVAVFVIFLLYWGGSILECKAKVSGMSADWNYSMFAGCLIRPQGEQAWVPLANYRWFDQ